MDIWTFIKEKLSIGHQTMIMIVLDSKGSSPGRQGFKMAVSSDHDFFGSIGGGIMEHKLVERGKHKLKKKSSKIEFLIQFHDKDHAKNQSGMICSGQQSIALVPIAKDEIKMIHQIVKAYELGEQGKLIVNNKEMKFIPGIKEDSLKRIQFDYRNEEEWKYTEIFNKPLVVHILGAGHVALALSEVLRFSGFYVKLYDDRIDLNTMVNNHFAHEKIIIDYTKMKDQFYSNKDDYIVIMSFGYRNDREIYLQLLDNEFSYIGMMGSVEKIKKLMKEFEELKIPPEKITKLHAPIGINIHSKTPQEIAISIAAEIIKHKNKNFSGERKYKLK